DANRTNSSSASCRVHGPQRFLLAEDLVQAIEHPGEFLIRGSGEPLAEAVDGQRSDLTDLDPRRLRQPGGLTLPACSCPRAGLISAQRTSPLSIRATTRSPEPGPRRQAFSRRACSVWPIPVPTASGQVAEVYPPRPIQSPDFDCGIGGGRQARRPV